MISTAIALAFVAIVVGAAWLAISIGDMRKHNRRAARISAAVAADEARRARLAEMERDGIDSRYRF